MLTPLKKMSVGYSLPELRKIYAKNLGVRTQPLVTDNMRYEEQLLCWTMLRFDFTILLNSRSRFLLPLPYCRRDGRGLSQDRPDGLRFLLQRRDETGQRFSGRTFCPGLVQLDPGQFTHREDIGNIATLYSVDSPSTPRIMTQAHSSGVHIAYQWKYNLQGRVSTIYVIAIV